MTDLDTIKQYILDEFLPGVSPDELDADYHLVANGVIDSLGLLRVVSWIGTTFGIPMEDVEIVEQDFTTIASIDNFVGRHTIAIADAA
ncbi:phosphopantetheine-binding protein [Amycolatopsis sp. lyj-112]|uniref:phosphopantetheine-binding protein n=1 Tax=Amycolatopsis sp. lyj-112 TaxID=2789288 RepID=UPI00397B3021